MILREERETEMLEGRFIKTIIKEHENAEKPNETAIKFWKQMYRQGVRIAITKENLISYFEVNGTNRDVQRLVEQFRNDEKGQMLLCILDYKDSVNIFKDDTTHKIITIKGKKHERTKNF